MGAETPFSPLPSLQGRTNWQEMGLRWKYKVDRGWKEAPDEVVSVLSQPPDSAALSRGSEPRQPPGAGGGQSPRVKGAEMPPGGWGLMAGDSPAFPKVRWRAGVFPLVGLTYTAHTACCCALGSCCHPARRRTNIQWSLFLLSQDLGDGLCLYHCPFDCSSCHCFSTNPQFNGEGCLEDNFLALSDLMPPPSSPPGATMSL